MIVRRASSSLPSPPNEERVTRLWRGREGLAALKKFSPSSPLEERVGERRF